MIDEKIYLIKLEVLEMEGNSDLLPKMFDFGNKNYYESRPEKRTTHTIRFETNFHGLSKFKKCLEELNEDARKAKEIKH